MPRQLFPKADLSKSFVVFLLMVVCLMVLTGSSCDPKHRVDRPSHESESAFPATDMLEPADAMVIQSTANAICQGDFERAQQLLEDIPENKQAHTIQRLLGCYEQIEQLREEKRQAAFEEQLQELETIKEKVSSKDIPDVNDIDETMVALIRAREYALPEEKKQLLDDPFIQKILTRMKINAEQEEREGKWLDAYAHCYYWLSSLYEEDQSYLDKAEELTELSAIELSLKDSSCGETAQERYEGIEAVMFLRAIQLLHTNYVNTLDYHQIAQEALNRCRLLGRVFARTQETLAWTVTKEQIDQWDTGLDTLSSSSDESSQSFKDVKEIAGLLEDVLVLNSITLKLPEEVIVAHFSEASLAYLDPFTNLVWPWNVKDFEKSMTQQFTGIGVEISKATGVLKVVSLLPDTPAYRSGLDADDEILAVDGEPTEEMTIFCAVSKITGPKGSKVTLSIRRPSIGETKDIVITRDKIVVQPLRGWTRDENGQWDYMVDPENGIGYIRLTAFTETSGPDLDEVLRKLEKEGLQGLILDLRFNSGGYLQAAAEVVDLFISEGVIVKSNPRQGIPTYEIAHRSGTHPDYPLVVLINGSSASASEIVAGALQDSKHQRATLVGERSYGKGSVQVVTPFTGGGSQLKYTVAYYHLPSDQQVKNRYQMEKQGRTDWGIAPDVEIELFSNELREMIDIQRDNDVLTRMDHQANGGQSKRHTLEDMLRADPQLSIGLLVVQSKLICQGKCIKLDSAFAATPSDQMNQESP